MVATVVAKLTNITLANDNTGFTSIKVHGNGGVPSPVSETDVFIQGTGSCSIKVSNQGIRLWYDNGSGIDFSSSGDHVYIWVNMLAGGLMRDRDFSTTEPGLAIALGTTTDDWSIFAVDGADTYPGGWVRYVIDPTKSTTSNTGTGLDTTSIRYFGMYCNTRPNVAKFDNLVIDRIDYGTGLRVHGTSTTDDTFGDIINADEGTIGNVYGIARQKEGVIFLRGSIDLGDNVGTNAATLTDTDKTVVFENPEYWDGTSVVSAISTSLYSINFVGNGTGATDITLGKKVGTGDTAQGRNGLTISSNGPDVSMDFDDANVNAAKIYGTTLRQITTLSWGTNTAHEFIGNTVDQCGQFDPVGGIEIRNCTFSGYAGTDSALLWNANIDIKNSAFIANADGTNNPAGVEHPSATGSPFTYDNLTFSGNDFDINNSAGSAITVQANNGADPVTSTGSAVTIQNTVSLTVKATDSAGVVVENVRCAIYTDPGGVELMNELSLVTGLAQENYTYAGDQNVVIKARKYGFKQVKSTGVITTNGFTATTVMIVDPQQV